MVAIEKIIVTDNFEKDIRKMKDRKVKERIDKEVKKISANPDFGKPLEYGLKGEKTIRIKPYRLIYKVEGTNLILLRFEHRKGVYD
jgi:mRNA-degrading endonuclease RelE of RelBE toxin-antitoxin system